MMGSGAGKGGVGRQPVDRGTEGEDRAQPIEAPIERWGGAVFAVAAAVLTLLFYREFVFHPDRMIFGTDMLLEGHPLRGFALDEVREGRGLPGWNPFLNGGHPFLSTLPGPVFYPSTLLYLLLPLHRAIGWTFVLHTFLAGLFAYFAGRSFRLGRGASAVAGFTFMFSGYLLSTLYGGHDGRMFALVLMPLALGLLERGLRSGAPGWFLGLGAVVALQIFTPHTQIMYFSSLALVTYAALRVWTLFRAARREQGLSGHPDKRGPEGRGWGYVESGSRPRDLLRPGALLVLAFAVAAALGAIQLLPTYQLLEHVVRAAAEEGYEFAASWALPPQELTALFLPDLVGQLNSYWGTNPFKLHTEYLGIVPFALATLAVAASLGRGPRSGGRERHEARPLDRPIVWILAGISALGVLFALGAATPVHRIAYTLVPMMDSFRAPSMMLGPVAVFAALLAGAGWERARAGRRPGSSIPWLPVSAVSAPFLLVGLGAALAPAGLLEFAYHAWFPSGWPRTPPPELEETLRFSGWVAVVGWSSVLAGARALETGRVGEWALIPLLALLVLDLWRVDDRFLRVVEAEAQLDADQTVRALADEIGPGERSWPVEGTYHPNELMQHGIPVITGTQKFLLDGYDRLVGGVQQENLLRYPVLWGLFDLRYLIARSELEVPLLRPVEVPGPLVRVYELTERTPHAFFPERVRAAADTAEARRLTLEIPDPRAEAVVEARRPPPAGAGSARLTEWTPDEVVLEVSAEREGLLFISELWAPGWRAEVEGREIPIHRTNTAFRGLHLPAGDHQLRLTYAAPGYRTGRAVSAVTLLLLFGALGWIGTGKVRRRRGSAS